MFTSFEGSEERSEFANSINFGYYGEVEISYDKKLASSDKPAQTPQGCKFSKFGKEDLLKIRTNVLNLVKEEVNNYGKKKERKFHLQMDKILKRLFTLKNTMPTIDFLNPVYNDNISYDVKLYYADKEINNFDKKSSICISFYADMYIKVIDREKIYEYEIEVQMIYETVWL